jgi:branched-chain amino acid transport system substrate-binding protein
LPGAELAVEEINKAGGVLGRPLQLIHRDSALSPEKGLREAKDLVMKEKVFWVMGAVSSSVSRAVSEFCRGNKVIYCMDQAKSPKLTAEWGHRYAFHATNNVYVEVIGVSKAAVEIFGPLKKVYNLSPDYEGGHAAWRNFKTMYKKLVPDFEEVGSAWPKLGTQEFSPYLTAIKNSGAELVFSAFYQTDALTLIKQSIGLGLNGNVAMASVWWAENMVPKFSKDFYPKKTISSGVYPFWDIDKPESMEFVRKIKAKANVYPTYAICAYSWVKLMAEAIEKAGRLDTEKVVDYLEGAVMNTPIGPVEIRQCDHQAMWPTYIGEFGKLDDWHFYGTKNNVVYGSEIYRTCEEVKKLQDRKRFRK